MKRETHLTIRIRKSWLAGAATLGWACVMFWYVVMWVVDGEPPALLPEQQFVMVVLLVFEYASDWARERAISEAPDYSGGEGKMK